ncbi:MAG: hypothetical protein ACR2QJ_10470 [Geminicoccaceae bacterium]
MRALLASVTAATVLCGNLMAQTVEPDSSKPVEGATNTSPGVNQIDRAQELTSKAVLATGEWFDSFFGDDRYQEEQNRSQVRLGTGAFFDSEGEADFGYRSTARILLPKTKRRFSLSIGAVIDEEDEDGNLLADSDLDDDDLNDDDDGVGVGANYAILQRRERNLSLRSSILWRSGKPVFSIGPRYRETVPLDENWDLRLINTFKYFTDDGFYWHGILDFERPIGDAALLRIGPNATWKEDDSGVDYEANARLFTALSETQAIEYQFNNSFETKASTTHDETNFRLRYRQQVWREWLQFEAAPEVIVLSDAEWEFTPGIQFRIELIFGGT